MAHQHSAFNACQNRYPVTLKPSEVQRALYSNHKALELYFRQVKLSVYVPVAVARGETPAHEALYVHFHGGGLLTGKSRFPAWSNVSINEATLDNQIQIHPQYPLMPEASGEQIAEYAVHVVKLIADGSIRRELVKECPQMDLPESKRWVCSGTSAGAFLAIRSAIERLDTVIDAVVLLSPMLEVYTRHAGHKYGRHTLSEMEHQQLGLETLIEAADRREQGVPVLGRLPPDHMSIYPSTTTGCKVRFNGRLPAVRSFWGIICGTYSTEEFLEQIYLRDNFKFDIPREKFSPSFEFDAGEVAQRLGERRMKALGLVYFPEENVFEQHASEPLPPTPLTWPPTYIVHGDADTNCRLEGVERVVQLIQRLWPATTVCLYISKGMPHAFDCEYPDVEEPHTLARDVKGLQQESALLKDVQAM
ncbi:hypothetical protein PSPO01_04909 [Paraphaeosphaeria sporulosa]